MRDHYELGDTTLKSNESLFLFHSDTASVEIGKETFAVPVKVKSEIRKIIMKGLVSGFVFQRTTHDMPPTTDKA